MSSAPTPQEIWSDARWVAQAVDPIAGLVRVVEMSAEDYRDASFLDDRILEPSRRAHLLEWSDVAGAMPASARSDARWIFHIGHVGSTLISRLLGELDLVLAVREPRALRDLTFFPVDIRGQFVPTLRALMSRTFDAGTTAVVKATSMVSEIASELNGPRGRALFLYVSPSTYLQTILAGGQSQADLQRLSDYYSARAVSQEIALGGPTQGAAEVAALVWACEMTALGAAAESTKGKVLWQDFDGFLKAPEASLNSIARFFGLSAEESRVTEIARGPLMGRYSKALDHEFGPKARRALLERAAVEHGPKIQSALARLREAAENDPALASAIHRSAPGL